MNNDSLEKDTSGNRQFWKEKMTTLAREIGKGTILNRILKQKQMIWKGTVWKLKHLKGIILNRKSKTNDNYGKENLKKDNSEKETANIIGSTRSARSTNRTWVRSTNRTWRSTNRTWVRSTSRTWRSTSRIWQSTSQTWRSTRSKRRRGGGGEVSGDSRIYLGVLGSQLIEAPAASFRSGSIDKKDKMVEKGTQKDQHGPKTKWKRDPHCFGEPFLIQI